MKPGNIVLTPTIESPIGKLTADDGQELVCLFLGTVAEGQDPHAEKRLYELGWRQATIFEAVIGLRSDEASDETVRVMFSCLGGLDAIEAAIRFGAAEIRDLVDVFGTSYVFDRVLVRLVTIGGIDGDGRPQTSQNKPFFYWQDGKGISLHDYVKKLRNELAQKYGSLPGSTTPVPQPVQQKD